MQLKENGRRENNMKKTLSIILAALMAASLTACVTVQVTVPEEVAQELKEKEEKAKEKPGKEKAGETKEAAAETKEKAELANPMKEIEDSAQFEEQLGIRIDPDMLYSESRMFITNGEFAEVQFAFNNPMGEEVTVTLRATKDPEVGKQLSGVYEELKEVNTFDYAGVNRYITIRHEMNEAGDLNVYTWENDNTFYSAVIKGNPSQMEVAEVMDSIMAAVGELRESMTDTAWYELSADDTILTVRLRSNPTTGYQWSYKIGDPVSVEEVTSEYVEDQHEDGMVGVGGTWVCSFRVITKEDRKTDITFTYGRSWEKRNVPSRALDLRVSGGKFEILDAHTPDLDMQAAPDGTQTVIMRFNKMLEENELSFYAECEAIAPVILTDEEVKALKAGDTLRLSERYEGAWDLQVDRLKKKDEKTIEVNDEERLSYDEELGGWKIIGWDDDVTSYITDTFTYHFTNETEIDDQMEAIMKTGNVGTIYDKMRDYTVVTADITVKDGEAKKVVIHYHP